MLPSSNHWHLVLAKPTLPPAEASASEPLAGVEDLDGGCGSLGAGHLNPISWVVGCGRDAAEWSPQWRSGTQRGDSR